MHIKNAPLSTFKNVVHYVWHKTLSDMEIVTVI